MSVPAVRCARCVAGQCGHVMCKPGGSYQLRVTDVAGTACCADCAPALLELVLHPPHGAYILPDPDGQTVQLPPGCYRSAFGATIHGPGCVH